MHQVVCCIGHVDITTDIMSADTVERHSRLMCAVHTRVRVRVRQQAVQTIDTVWQHWSGYFEAMSELQASTALLLPDGALLHLNTEHITLTGNTQVADPYNCSKH